MLELSKHFSGLSIYLAYGMGTALHTHPLRSAAAWVSLVRTQDIEGAARGSQPAGHPAPPLTSPPPCH